MDVRYILPADDRGRIRKICEESWKSAYQGIIPQEYLDFIPDGAWAPAIDNQAWKTLVCMGNAQTAYEHCELSVNGEPILAVAEAPEAYDASVIHRMKWQTMTLNAFELGSTDAVQNAFHVPREGGAVIEAIHELPWSQCCATVIDRYGVCWWIGISR